MDGSKTQKIPSPAKAAAMVPAKKTATKKRRKSKSVKPNFNTYIYRVLKEVRVDVCVLVHCAAMSTPRPTGRDAIDFDAFADRRISSDALPTDA